MKTFAAALALSLATIPAQAQNPASGLNGFQFYNRCTNAPPDRSADVMAMCATYVAGIADTLTVEGAVCMGPNMTAPRLLQTALGWIQFRAQNSGYPAVSQIKTGLMTLYPCRRNNVPVRQHVNPDQVIDRTTKVIELLKDMAPLLAYLH